MCGFIGRLILRPGPDLPTLDRGLPTLARRGPDGCHRWSDPTASVELLHVRLAVVDPDERARQPFSDADSGVTIAFNGEVYNYEELRDELAPYPFRTRSDTEVLLAVFLRWGAPGLQRVRGMLAGAIVDPRLRRLWLFRDALGKKPLFIARWPDGVWFGSSVLALAATARRPGAIDDTSRDQFWRREYVAPHRSILVGCEPVRPGDMLALDFDGSQVERVACTPIGDRDAATAAAPGSPTDSQGAAGVDPRAASRRLDELLRTSIRRRLHNNPVPVSLLSGGIDSTIVTSQMASSVGGRAIALRSLVPFTLDEPYARFAARRIGVSLDLVGPTWSGLPEEALFAVDLQDEPLGMMSFVPLALLVRHAREYGKILLTGDGADEVFLGYGAAADWRKDTSAAATNAEYLDEPEIVAGLPAPAWMSRWGCFAVGQSLVGHMFAKLDRATAEQGVEARCPLVDWDLLAYARRLPPQVLLLGGRPKGLLKSQLRGWPRWFVHRRKLGFAYHLRWAWSLSRFRGLREHVSREAVETFDARLPPALRRAPGEWGTRDVLNHFSVAWKLLVWSRFLARMS